MDLDLQQFVKERAKRDDTIEESDAVILQLQDRLLQGLRAARNKAEQLARKDAALHFKDKQIQALTARLAQHEQGSYSTIGVVPVRQSAGSSGKKRSRQGIAQQLWSELPTVSTT
jgi:site-specific recombinase